eukprot:GABV01003226.1.p1 GENE.GABV01003226.1~~GABV01003226.1.p1  ORF type:complete len:136 (-),score=14.97 GABV01003226.1:33-440(-)
MSANLWTIIGRVVDGMPVAGTQDNAVDMKELKREAKDLLKSFDHTSPSMCSIGAGNYTFHYVIENGVCYLALTETSYPRRLVFDFLSAVQKEFEAQHGHEVHQYSRPYAATTFSPVLKKLRNSFLDPRSPETSKN